MSAIAGVLRFDGAPVRQHELEQMAAIMSTYGRDRSAYVIRGSVGLVHCLERNTAEDKLDAQPLTGRSGSVIAADLRLDNRDHIARLLAIGVDASSRMADSSLLLPAWEKFGNRVWPRLRGPFAVAIWNPASHVLTLARDQMGIYPLCWYRSSSCFAFASVSNGLFALPTIPRALNEEKFADFLVLNHRNHLSTLYQGISRVLPAHWLSVDVRGKLSQSRYWEPKDIPKIGRRSDDDYAAGLKEVLQTAVTRQLRTQFGVGCLLSGGIDSSSVAALAAKDFEQRGENFATYTHVAKATSSYIVPAGYYEDERPYVNLISKLLGNLNPHFEQDEGALFGDLDSIFSSTNLPVRNPTNLPWMLALRRRGYLDGRRVLLSGQHGNFSISWHGWSQVAANVRAGRLILAFNQWRQFVKANGGHQLASFSKLIGEPLFGGAPMFPRRIGDRPWLTYSPLNPCFDAAGVVERARAAGHEFSSRLRPSDRYDAATKADFDAEWGKGLAAVTGVEVRDPTADIDVISYCLAIPATQFLAGGIDRSLVRRAMKGLLPDEVLYKNSRGEQSPTWHEKLTLARPSMIDELRSLSSSSLVEKLIDVKRLLRNLEGWPTGKWEHSAVRREYRFVLTRGLAAAKFLTWFESRAFSDPNELSALGPFSSSSNAVES